KLSQVDKGSWDYVSQYGTDQEVFAFLEQNNIHHLDISRVAWRARQSVDFFRKLVALLEQRHRFDGTIYSYALLHNETAPLGRWLRHQDSLLNESGRYLTSRLVTIDPIERRSYQHLEYSPLVNQRAHQ